MAKGYTQLEGIDYEETFSPVVKFASIRLILALVAHFDLELHQMDVKTTFLNCSDPRAQPDPIGESEPKLWVRSFNPFYLHFIKFSFQKCRDPNPRLDPKGGSKPEPGLLRRFQLSYQNIFFMLFLFRFSICAEAFSNGWPINIYIS